MWEGGVLGVEVLSGAHPCGHAGVPCPCALSLCPAPQIIAADLLAQAEHDVEAIPILGVWGVCALLARGRVRMGCM
jgi:hypothetical protein